MANDAKPRTHSFESDVSSPRTELLGLMLDELRAPDELLKVSTME